MARRISKETLMIAALAIGGFMLYEAEKNKASAATNKGKGTNSQNSANSGGGTQGTGGGNTMGTQMANNTAGTGGTGGMFQNAGFTGNTSTQGTGASMLSFL
jgi:hypothetical protein